MRCKIKKEQRLCNKKKASEICILICSDERAEKQLLAELSKK
jgi:hypothetical protein